MHLNVSSRKVNNVVLQISSKDVNIQLVRLKCNSVPGLLVVNFTM